MPTITDLVREAYSHWNDAETLSRTGRELHDRNRLDIAKEVLARAIELDPKDEDAWTYLAFAHYRSFDDEEGSATLRRGIEATGSDDLKVTLSGFTSDEEEGARLREEVEQHDSPGIAAALLTRRFYGGEEGALGEMRELVEANPEDEDVGHNFLWLLFGGKHRGLLGEMDVREPGVPVAERIVGAHPDRMSGYWLLAQLYAVERDWDGLLGVAERALSRFPDEETVMQLKGRALREKGDLDRAEQCFARAIGAKPSFAGARIDLGKLYEERGKAELAEEIFREIPVANPDYAPGPMSLALFLGRQGRFEEAEKVFLATWPVVPEWFRAGLRQNPDAEALLARPAIKELVEAGG